MMTTGDMSVASIEGGLNTLGGDPVVAGRKPRRDPRVMGPVIWAAVGWVVFLVLLSLVVQWLPIHNYTGIAGNPNVNPGFQGEFLGTDDIGRSMLSRLAFGARVSLIISFAATAISAVVGSLLGLLSVYFKGFVNAIADIATNSVLAVPHLLLLLTIILAFGPSMFTLIWAIGIIHIPQFMRLMRANALSQYSREYIVAAKALGASQRRIIMRELLPNTAPALVSYAMLVLSFVMILEGSLSFLGFGVQPPLPSWGAMISLGAQNLTTSPWQAFLPCLTLFVTVFSFNTLGDYLRVRLDVRDAKL